MRAILLLTLFAALARPAAAQTEFNLFGSLGNQTAAQSANRQSPFNPQNVLGLERAASAGDVTVFGNLTPGSRAWKLHLKLKATGDIRPESGSRAEISELFWNMSLTPWLNVGAGRKIERWGTGYGWNPTGVVNPPKDPADARDRRDLDSGTDMIATNILAGGWSLSVLGVPRLRWEDGPKLDGAGWAARIYRFIGGVDVSATASGGSALPNSLGISGARVFGNSLELHGDFARIEDGGRAHSQLVAGGHYTFANRLNILFEYFHNGLGLTESEWNGFQDEARQARRELESGNPQRLIEVNRQFSPTTMGRDYALARVYWPIRQNRLELETTVIASLHDSSLLFQPGLHWRPRPNLNIYWIHSEFAGGARTEFGGVQIKRSAVVGVRYHFSFNAALRGGQGRQSSLSP